MPARRYDVRIGGHRFYFHYDADRQRYRLTVGDVPHEGEAASLREARREVREIILAALAAPG